MRRAPSVAAVVLVACLAPAAGAQIPTPGPETVTRTTFAAGSRTIVAVPGSARLTAGHVDAVPVTAADPDGPREVAAEDFGQARLRVLPSLTVMDRGWRGFQLLQIAADADVTSTVGNDALDDALAWDTLHEERSRDARLRLMQAYLFAAGRSAAVKAGLVRSAWGPGILANDGESTGEGVARSPFGYPQTADRVLRLQVAWMPLEPDLQGAPLTLAVAADAVIDDDTADWAAGDRTWNLIGAVLGRVGDFRGGLYAVHRTERHADGGRTQVTAFDVTGHQDLVKGDLTAWLEGELAVLLGQTTYSQSAILPGPYDITATGGVVRFGIQRGWFEGVLEGGAASGDDNPFDTRLRAFSFDREYRVGLLMFREALRKTTAVTASNLADPLYRARPARGFERTATSGAVQGAVYVNPRLAFGPFQGVTVQVGYLRGASQADYTDPFQSGLQGGVSVGPNGARFASHLGDEIDLGVTWRRDLERMTLRARAEGAWFSPGRVFADADGDVPDDLLGGWLHVEALW